ncbi:MAG: hypothetical protein Q7R95_10975 [bacterium]|nr:hypothetical protein [bacterium]
MKMKNLRFVSVALLLVASLFVKANDAHAITMPVRLSAVAPKSIVLNKPFTQVLAISNTNSFFTSAILPFNRTVFFPSNLIANVKVTSATNGILFAPVVTADGVTYTWKNSGVGLRNGTASIIKFSLTPTSDSNKVGNGLLMMTITDKLSYAPPVKYNTNLLAL